METVTRTRLLRGQLWLAAAAIFALGLGAASADYRASYEKGIKAIDNKDWTGAIDALRAAAAEKSVEGERILIYGMRFKPYLPHYYLGLAYFNTGDCQAAMKAWAESERQGAVRETAEYKTLQSLRERCRGQGVRESEPTQAPSPARGADVKQAVAEAEAEIRRTETAAAAVARLRSEPDSARLWQSEPSLRQKESKANQDLASARVLLGEAKAGSDPSRIGAARDAAIRARQEFEALQKLVTEYRDRLQRETLEKQAKEGQARAREAALEKQAKEREAREKQAALDSQAKERQAKEEAAAEKTRAALAEFSQKVREARQLLADASRHRPLPAGVDRPRSDLEGVLGEAQRAGPTTSPSDLERLKERLGKSTASLRTALNGVPAVPPPPAERKPPAALLQGAAAYFQGDYDKAAKTLEGAEFPDPRAAAQARLLRGAARYGVFVTGGEKDERLRQQAIEDVRECLRLDPKIVVSTRAFSPRFVEFFKRNGSQTGG